jgi:hypothetical protein
MADDKPIGRFARFVADKMEQFERAAGTTSGRWPELFAQHFTDHVDRLAARVQQPRLREYLLDQAEGTGQYLGREPRGGRFEYDGQLDALRWKGETPVSWKQVDGYGQWVRKSSDERARYALGHFGEDSRTQNDYPGIQVEKNGVVGPVKWGPEQPTAQDAHEFAEGMLDRHLGFSAPVLQPSSRLDIRKSDEMSKLLGADVKTKAWKKYAKDCDGERYGARESVERELPPPRRSR